MAFYGFIKIMKPGNIIEYIDRQRIICAAVMEIKNKKLRLLTENDREVKLSLNRVSHKSGTCINLSLSRYELVVSLKAAANKRKDLVGSVNVRELWDILHAEQEWVDLATMTELCFPADSDADHEAAVVRAIFNDRIYFKFDHDRFFPNSEKRVEQIAAHRREEAGRNRIIEEGVAWLKTVNGDTGSFSPDSLSGDKLEYVKILKSFYLFEKESTHYALGKAMLEKAGIRAGEAVFQLLVKLAVWDKDENIELYRYKIPITFPAEVTKRAEEVGGQRSEVGGQRAEVRDQTGKRANRQTGQSSEIISTYSGREDLTMLPVITIDGQSTTDFDDALSIEDNGDHYRLGIHISDVCHFIKKGDIIDREALVRGSSIYMMDQKISMIPSCLAENLCSLKAGELRPAVSIMVKISRFYEIVDYEIVPSIIRVKRQLTYYDVNTVADSDKEIVIFHNIAKNFREYRLSRGAVQITLPEINVWINGEGELAVTRVNRESAGRMLVAEIMIMANWLTARFLAKHDVPAIFRSQPEPRGRLYKGHKGSLFQNWMQRKLLSRFVLGHKPEHHSGLGLDAYVTTTSPIRKYYDLATQRQIRAILGFEELYTADETEHTMQLLAQPMSCVSKMQYSRNRYWLLKYLEKRVGRKEEAIVLSKMKNGYQVLVPEYMLECELPLSSGIELKPEDLIQIRIQHVNARKNIISVFMG
ncbi:MAG: exoribonuclease II [Desulfobacteraceae bacterium Eth-SRB1]|nr:MAG: exoribonuclease II [Desulfobacteraceae bacterium Eth-SRB1]